MVVTALRLMIGQCQVTSIDLKKLVLTLFQAWGRVNQSMSWTHCAKSTKIVKNVLAESTVKTVSAKQPSINGNKCKQQSFENL